MKLKIDNINFAYNGENVLQGLSCTIKKGDFIALVGPNGSGKSTLLKCLNKILVPQTGTISLNDIELKDIRFLDIAKEMAYVPQNESKTMYLSVFDLILTGRKPHIGWKPSKNDIDFTAKIIERLDIENIAMKNAGELSGGQQQMVYIARAMVQEPQILILDEPTANLDLKHQFQILEILKELSKKGTSIIIALHDINMALKYANKYIMLKQKNIFAQGGKEIINKKNIEKLYDVEVRIIDENDQIFILPVNAN